MIGLPSAQSGLSTPNPLFGQSGWQKFGRAGKRKCGLNKDTQQTLAEMPEANETNK